MTIKEVACGFLLVGTKLQAVAVNVTSLGINPDLDIRKGGS
jgi:hypothetical protein